MGSLHSLASATDCNNLCPFQGQAAAGESKGALPRGALTRAHTLTPIRGKLLDDSETALVESTANAQSVAAKAKERYRAARGGFCWTCLMLLTVAAVFAAMMVYIKMTAMVGCVASGFVCRGFRCWVG